MQELKSPLLLVIEVTGRCNLRCDYCYAEAWRGAKSTIPLATLKRVVDEARDLGVFDINICGGEPFMHEHIVEILAYIRAKGLDISLNTNATLINEALSKKLAELDVIKDTQVSFDAHIEQIHNATRGGFRSALRGFMNLCSQTKREFAPVVGIVVNKHNVGALVDCVAFFSQYTRRFHLMNVMNNANLALDETQKRTFEGEILPNLQDFASKNGVLISQFTKSTKAFALKDSHIDCLAGYTFVALTSSLDIVPCDIARIPIAKYGEYGDIARGYEAAKNAWKLQKCEWCKGTKI